MYLLCFITSRTTHKHFMELYSKRTKHKHESPSLSVFTPVAHQVQWQNIYFRRLLQVLSYNLSMHLTLFIHLFIYLSINVYSVKPPPTAKMCCSGFLKIMMFIFNGCIFVSKNVWSRIQPRECALQYSQYSIGSMQAIVLWFALHSVWISVGN